MLTTTLSNAEYHASEGISKSGLDLIAKSPAHYKAGFQSINPDIGRFGTVIHSYLLEGGDGIILGPDIKRVSKADKEAWDEFFMANGATHPIATAGFLAADQLPEFERQTGKTVVKASEYDSVMKMRDNALEVAGELLDGGVSEASIFFEYSGVKCRIRPDKMNTDKHFMVDAKSTKEASEFAFSRSCASYRYHVQHAFYATGYYEQFAEWPSFFFLAVEKTYPFFSCLYKLSDTVLDNGIALMNRDLETYAKCLESDEWPGYETNLSLEIPLYESAGTVDDLSELFL